jgi:hypothetical protein
MLAWAVAGVPQRWQNLAPGVSRVPHPWQVDFPMGVPHSAQNFPVTGAPHEGQGVGVVMEGGK